MKAQTEKHKPAGECKVTNVTVTCTANVKTTGEDYAGPMHMIAVALVCSSSSMQTEKKLKLTSAFVLS